MWHGVRGKLNIWKLFWKCLILFVLIVLLVTLFSDCHSLQTSLPSLAWCPVKVKINDELKQFLRSGYVTENGTLPQNFVLQDDVWNHLSRCYMVVFSLILVVELKINKQDWNWNNWFTYKIAYNKYKNNFCFSQIEICFMQNCDVSFKPNNVKCVTIYYINQSDSQ